MPENFLYEQLDSVYGMGLLKKKIPINKKICDKKIKVKKDSERANGQAEFLEDKDWYVFNVNYGTREEKAFVE